MLTCYSLCRAWSLHWQHYGRIQLVRGFGSMILPNRASLFGKRWQRRLFSTFKIGGGLINAGNPKDGRFWETRRLVVVDGDATAFVPNSTNNAKSLKRNVSQTWEQHSLKGLKTFNNISKSNHSDAYRENNRKTQRKIRHYIDPPQLKETNIVFFCHVISRAFVRWRSVSEAIRRL